MCRVLALVYATNGRMYSIWWETPKTIKKETGFKIVKMRHPTPRALARFASTERDGCTLDKKPKRDIQRQIPDSKAANVPGPRRMW